MFDRQVKLYSRMLLLADVVAVLPALVVAYYGRYYFVKYAPQEISQRFNPELLPFSDYLLYLLVFLPVWFLVLVGTQRYGDNLRLPLRRQLMSLLTFFLWVGGLMALVTYGLKLEISRPIFFTFFAVVAFALPLNRALLYWVLRSRNINEHNQIRILVVGTEPQATEVIERLQPWERWGYHVVGCLTLNGSKLTVSGCRRLGTIEDLPQIVQSDAMTDEVIFAGVRRADLEAYEDVIRLCEELGIRTRIAADLVPIPASRLSVESLDNIPLLTFSSVPEHDLAVVFKRVIDFVVASLGLLCFSPLMLLTAMAIKFTTPGPVFYRQVRCGLYGRKFTLVKFRTMIDGAEDRLWEIKHLNEMDGPVFKMRNDPRVTVLGRILRKTSIDELPQLWNVVKGEMSIVGPRAPLVEEVEHYSIRQRRRLSVKPGITCLWQVSGRNNISFDRWMDMDLEYIDNWSFWLDLRIMLKTIPAVFTGRGAR
jgi:exopolysaccharide biosynthesis polyprenyl glycosylphosphotransferase